MNVRLGPRLLAGFFVVATIGLGVAAFLVGRSVERALVLEMTERLRYEVTMTGQMSASALFAPLEHDDASLVDPIHELANAVHTHLSIIAPDGTVVADSSIVGPPLAAAGDAPEVRDAIAFGRGEARRGEGANARVWVAEAIRRDGELLGVARASMPMREVEAHMVNVRQDLAVGAVVALFVATAIGVLLTIGIVRPVRKLAAAARRIGKGELGARAGIDSGDEIGDLGGAIDDMATSLQKLVASIDARNADMRSVLDGVDQGLVTVDVDGRIAIERSRTFDDWFSKPAAGAFLWDVFPQLGETARLSFRLGWEEIGADVLPLELVLDQLPARITGGDRTFALRYLPLAAAQERRFLVVVSDVTAELAAEQTEAVQRDLLRAIEGTMRDRESVSDFVRDADALFAVVADARSADGELLRALHTVKGNAGLFGLSTLVDACHALEGRLATQERSATPIERAELGARWARLREGVVTLLGGDDDRLSIHREDYAAALRAVASGAPQREVLGTLLAWQRMPVARPLERLSAHASALALRMGKRVVVTTHDGGLRVDGERWGAFFSALVHAVRNAIDHGIEAPHERKATGKPPTGALELRAELESDRFVVSVRDDGRGIAWDAVARALAERGRPAKTRADLEAAIFADGLSTRDEASDVSGRGVGMSALSAAVVALGGRVEITSETTRGTTLHCVFPRSTVALDAPRLLALAVGCPTVASGSAQCLCLPPCLPCLATVLPSFLCEPGLADAISSLAPPALGDASTISS